MAEIEFSGAVVYVLGGVKKTKAPGTSLRQVLENLETAYPSLAGKLLKEGKLSRVYLVYVDEKDVRFGAGPETPVGENTGIKIMNALTGG